MAAAVERCYGAEYLISCAVGHTLIWGWGPYLFLLRYGFQPYCAMDAGCEASKTFLSWKLILSLEGRR